jgi:hypothetical protein
MHQSLEFTECPCADDFHAEMDFNASYTSRGICGCGFVHCKRREEESGNQARQPPLWDMEPIKSVQVVHRHRVLLLAGSSTKDYSTLHYVCHHQRIVVASRPQDLQHFGPQLGPRRPL